MASAISNLLKIPFNYKPTPTVCCLQKQILESPHSLYYPFPRRKKNSSVPYFINLECI